MKNHNTPNAIDKSDKVKDLGIIEYKVDPACFVTVSTRESLYKNDGLLWLAGSKELTYTRVEVPLVKRIAVKYNKRGTPASDNVALIAQIDNAFVQRKREGPQIYEKYQLLSQHPFRGDSILGAWIQTGTDPRIPKFLRRMEFLRFDEPGKEPMVFIGITGMNFRSIGPGCDAPVDDSWEGVVIAKVGISLCPMVLQEALSVEGESVTVSV